MFSSILFYNIYVVVDLLHKKKLFGEINSENVRSESDQDVICVINILFQSVFSLLDEEKRSDLERAISFISPKIQSNDEYVAELVNN